jgi:hypothetical protein
MKQVYRYQVKEGDYIKHDMLGGYSIQKVVSTVSYGKGSPYSEGFVTNKGVTYYWDINDKKDTLVEICDEDDIALLNLQS